VKRLAPLTLALFVLPSVALAAGGSNDETERLNPADMTLAKRATVHKSDLAPGWRLVRSGPPKSSDEPCTSFDPDLSTFVITGKASAKPGFLRCLRTAVLQGLRKANFRGRITSSRMSTTPRVGAESVSFRVVAVVYPTKTVPRFTMYSDVLAFRQGRSQAVLLFMAPLTPVRGQVALARSVQRRMQ
jgi:hypothetical protein